MQYYGMEQLQTHLSNGVTQRRQRPLQPPLRWAGGKRFMAMSLKALLPKDYESYVEPMAGSAALFFAVCPKKAVLSDLNADLINYYRVLRNSAELLVPALMEMSASNETYYSLRSSHPDGSLEQAIRFAYLNRLCWNGVYRVNMAGFFNVPIGNRLPKVLWEVDHLFSCSQRLQAAELRTCDVLASIGRTRKDDFLFIDPPYPKGAPGVGFNRYTSTRFSFADHKLLSLAIRGACLRGVKVMVILSRQRQFVDLYQDGFRKQNLPSKSLIACNGESRGSWSECVLTNYEPAEEP
jgi:DNA adenine methylase